ncbi:MAG: hypothetical protein K9I71_06475 [Ignavibacteriales bacterium]|nr:hypothetical protein [Ignavibacteriales bacterium]MCF8315748.1 hypothetical protein [Ignavibacteriales bacterium]MCF8437058.1 hypothetical protein [Ignavibacteriales bacterium]
MKYPITILGEIHFSYRVIYELIQNKIIPEIIIINNNSYEKFDKNIFKIKDNWTSVYKEYHLNWRKKLIKICKTYEIKLFITTDIVSVISYNKYLIVAGFSTILKNDILQYFELPLNIHPSLLPYFKGPQPEAQMIFNNQNYFGVTIHFITKQIDSGDIYFQQMFLPQNMNIYELEIVEGKIASIGIKNILSNQHIVKRANGVGSYFSFLKNEELCINNKKNTVINSLLRLLPEEFPYLIDSKQIIYPIELSDKKTEKVIDTGVDRIYLYKWIEKTSAHKIVYKSLGS